MPQAAGERVVVKVANTGEGDSLPAGGIPHNMKALLVGVGPTTQQIQTILRHAGVALEVSGSPRLATPSVWRLDLDVILVSLSPFEDRFLDALKAWRQAGLVTPLLACASREHLARCLDAGADRCVTDDLGAEELLARLRALVRRLPREESAIRVYDLLIDANSRVVQRAGQLIRLRRREYQLLTFLAYHRGRAVSRALIHTQLYTDHGSVSSNVVDVYIRYLRKKIDVGFDPPLILTRWGEGFLLRGDDG